MYKLADYLKFGTDFVWNNVFHRPHLSVLMFYVTNKCNSKCNICNIWRKQPKEDLSFEEIKAVLQSKCVDKQTIIGLEGGEFLLHPELDKILDFVSSEGYNFQILSNGLLPDKLLEVVTKYRVPRVNLSLDGRKETYKAVRNVDGYDKVLRSVELIKDKTDVSIMYTINPWNSQEDLDHVVGFCRDNGLDFRVGIYSNMEFFDTEKKMTEIDHTIDTNVTVSDFAENQEFLDMFELWREGKVILPCYSITQAMVVYPNGDIPLCQNKNIILGNIKEKSLDEILSSKETRQLHKQYKSCNDCWVSFHRKFDVALFRSLKFMPKFILKKLLGNYSLPK